MVTQYFFTRALPVCNLKVNFDFEKDISVDF